MTIVSSLTFCQTWYGLASSAPAQSRRTIALNLFLCLSDLFLNRRLDGCSHVKLSILVLVSLLRFIRLASASMVPSSPDSNVDVGKLRPVNRFPGRPSTRSAEIWCHHASGSTSRSRTAMLEWGRGEPLPKLYCGMVKADARRGGVADEEEEELEAPKGIEG